MNEYVPLLKQVLHVGCGGYSPEKLHQVFRGPSWRELRLDIDPDCAPDIIASITSMPEVQTASVDAVFSSHNLEHLYPHEVAQALGEFRRVLKPDGFALLTMPDLQSVAQLIVDDDLDATAYQSGLGPITPLDMLYGFRPALAMGNHFMGHRTGFTGKILIKAVTSAGFAAATVQRNPFNFSLWCIGFCAEPSAEQMAQAQNQMLPLHAMAQPA